MNPRTPLPADHGVRTDRSARLVDDGRLVIGGSPPHTRVLSVAQAGEIIRWLSGALPTDAGRALAADLIAAGMAHPRPLLSYPAALPSVITVEVDGAPSRAAALAATEADVIALIPPGSLPEPGWLETALAHFTDPSVAAVVPRALPDRARPLGYVEAAVATVAADLLGLDRGTDPGPILPWGHTRPDQAPPGPTNEFTTADPLCSTPAFLIRRRALDPAPGAALLAPEAEATRATAQDGDVCSDSPGTTTVSVLSRTVPATGARYDPTLGESADTDLLWALAEAGWSVRHEPRSRVRVPVPTDPVAYLRACYALGAAAGPLARRRGCGAAGPELPWSVAAGAALLLAGRPGAALASAALGWGTRTLALLACPPGGRVPPQEAARLAGLDLLASTHAGTRALRTTWWPAAVAAAGVIATRDHPSGRARRRSRAVAVTAALILPHAFAWRRRRGTFPVDPLTWTALRTAGDAARSLGTWWGAVRAGTPAPLLPRLRPGRFSARLRSDARAGAGR